MNFSPASCTHLEFSNISQTVSIPNTSTDEYKITSVTYKTNTGIVWNDMVITTSGNSFNYKCRFEYAVPRKVYYVMLSDDLMVLTKHSVNNIVDLPENYTSVYQVDNQAESMTVTFTVNGQERHATQSTDSSGQSTYNWSNWYSFTTTFITTITTNMDKHMELIRAAVKNGSVAKKYS